MAKPRSHSLSPAQATPLLEKALRDGEDIQRRDEDSDIVVGEWMKHIILVLAEVEGVATISFAALSEAAKYYKNAVANQLAGGPPNYAQYRRAGVSQALSVLKTQLQVLGAKGAGMSTNPGSGVVGKSVFIGHGRDPAWMELRQFLDKDLHLDVVEFDSVPTAGMTIVDRLKAMLGSVGFALLIMTGEDHLGGRKDAVRARQNVIHEIGLFQGKLGFEKAIILLEQGCQEFSNVSGLIYISFPKGNIQAAFHKVQKTLIAAGLVRPVAP